MLRSVLNRKSKEEGLAFPEKANVDLMPELSHKSMESTENQKQTPVYTGTCYWINMAPYISGEGTDGLKPTVGLMLSSMYKGEIQWEN